MLSPCVVAAFERCEREGWALCRGAVLQAAALLDEVADIDLEPLEPEVGPVRQTGATGVAPIAGRPRLEALATALGAASDGWLPDEVAVGRYGPGGGISAHRDNAFYSGFVAVLTLEGRARFRVLGDRDGTVVLADELVGAGDLALLRGPRGEGEVRPFHAVGPPVDGGGRTVLVLRRNDRGAGRGWR